MDLLWYESEHESDWLMMQLNKEIEKHENEYFIWLGMWFDLPYNNLNVKCLVYTKK